MRCKGWFRRVWGGFCSRGLDFFGGELGVRDDRIVCI